MLTHVVVTVYTKKPGAKPIIHAYGPYTRSKAQSERKKIIDNHWWLSDEEDLKVTANQMIDVESLNADASGKSGVLG